MYFFLFFPRIWASLMLCLSTTPPRSLPVPYPARPRPPLPSQHPSHNTLSSACARTAEPSSWLASERHPSCLPCPRLCERRNPRWWDPTNQGSRPSQLRREPTNRLSTLWRRPPHRVIISPRCQHRVWTSWRHTRCSTSFRLLWWRNVFPARFRRAFSMLLRSARRRSPSPSATPCSRCASWRSTSCSRRAASSSMTSTRSRRATSRGSATRRWWSTAASRISVSTSWRISTPSTTSSSTASVRVSTSSRLWWRHLRLPHHHRPWSVSPEPPISRWNRRSSDATSTGRRWRSCPTGMPTTATTRTPATRPPRNWDRAPDSPRSRSRSGSATDACAAGTPSPSTRLPWSATSATCPTHPKVSGSEETSSVQRVNYQMMAMIGAT